MSSPPVPTAMPNGLAAYIGVVQFFFVTTWTVYVIYLPALAQQAGIDKQWVPWILLADQLLFAIMDVAAGFWVDRLRRGLANFGGWILVITSLSCAAFVLLPFTAFAGSGVMLGLIVVWAVTSSALRSPPWALLSRYAARPDVPWLSTLVLTGTAIASAAAPYLGIALKGVDPRLPFVLSTVTLLAAVGGLVLIERRLAGAGRAGPSVPAGEAEAPFDIGAPGAKRLVMMFFLALLVMALGFQVHFALNAAPQYLRFAAATELPWLMPVFWVGFNLLMFPAALLVKRGGAIPLGISLRRFRILAKRQSPRVSRTRRRAPWHHSPRCSPQACRRCWPRSLRPAAAGVRSASAPIPPWSASGAAAGRVLCSERCSRCSRWPLSRVSARAPRGWRQARISSCSHPGSRSFAGPWPPPWRRLPWPWRAGV